jgi:hypothetical protein
MLRIAETEPGKSRAGVSNFWTVEARLRVVMASKVQLVHRSMDALRACAVIPKATVSSEIAGASEARIGR